ncbi:hypothetical protein BU16DRAFT_614675 [Lophium mytilinum]|uniref:Uncharacterized protein n=1 Tax=Lophium mytilinum TaxID=390894 RepID=A0A6A6R5L8_9PEZI|nr:hypothetical protein BU16DRAFT_614675 [Lophium mytilinum]
MGRQAYLTRLALGRSAFEVQDQGSSQPFQNSHPQTTESDPRTAPRNDYVQRYDERGHPVNPASREHGRILREAQNDVLAAIGVVERRALPMSEEDVQLLCRKIDILDTMESENNAGDLVAAVSTLADVLCTWWIGSLRDRILTFEMLPSMQFSTLIYAQYRSAGFWTFFCAGLPAHIFWSSAYQTTTSLVGSLRLIDSFLQWRQPSRRTRNRVQRWKPAINEIFRAVAKVAFFPLYYYSSLQRLHLVPIRPFLPPLESFIPFTPSSPIQRVPFPSTLTRESVTTFTVSLLASPLLLFFVEVFIERQVYGVIYDAIESRQLEAGSELAHSEEYPKPRTAKFIGLSEAPWGVFGSAIDTLLGYLRRAYIFDDELDGRRTPQERYIERELDRIRAEVDLGNLQLTDLERLDVPLAHAENDSRPMEFGESDTGHATMPLDLSRPVSPVSQTISEGSLDAMDPSVRITSREENDGIVELEVRLPQLASVTHEELATNASAARIHNGRGDDGQQWIFPRATKLSTEPSRMLGSILNSQIVTWARMPLQLAGLRLLARGFQAAHSQALSGRSVQNPLLGLRPFRVLERALLCGGIEFMGNLTTLNDASWATLVGHARCRTADATAVSLWDRENSVNSIWEEQRAKCRGQTRLVHYRIMIRQEEETARRYIWTILPTHDWSRNNGLNATVHSDGQRDTIDDGDTRSMAVTTTTTLARNPLVSNPTGIAWHGRSRAAVKPATTATNMYSHHWRVNPIAIT